MSNPTTSPRSPQSLGSVPEPLTVVPANLDSHPITTASPCQENPGAASGSGSPTPPRSSSSVSRSSPSLPPALKYPIGYGEQDDPRTRLLGLAGYNEDALAAITKLSIDKKIQLLGATKKQYFAYEGEVGDEREDPDYRVQLEASRALDELLGVKAPPAKQTVTVVHKVELPSWMFPEGAPPQVIEVSSQVST